MSIRDLKWRDIEAVSELLQRSFNQSIAPTLSNEGVATFMKVAEPQALALRLREGYQGYVYEQNDVVVGVIEVKEMRHIATLFVHPDYQHRGIGFALVNHALQSLAGHTITVRASLPSVPAYQRYGFRITEPAAEYQGLQYQPMAITLAPNTALAPNQTTPTTT